jgi:hypothetical protein
MKKFILRAVYAGLLLGQSAMAQSYDTPAFEGCQMAGDMAGSQVDKLTPQAFFALADDPAKLQALFERRTRKPLSEMPEDYRARFLSGARFGLKRLVQESGDDVWPSRAVVGEALNCNGANIPENLTPFK